MSNDKSDDVGRREFISVASMAISALAVGVGCDDGGSPTADAGPSQATDLPHLGGAPDTADGRTVAAFVDTLIPGAHRDPTGAPGGIDVDVPALFFDPALPAAPLVPIMVLLFNAAARDVRPGESFASLIPEDRELAVERAVETTPLLNFALLLTKVGYLGTREAGDHLGYPGPSAGYITDPGYSFGVAMSAEITSDGNLD